MPVTGNPGCCRARGLLASLVVLLLLPAPAAALEELLLGVTLNEVDKGACFAYRTPEGDLLFSAEDLRALGFRTVPGAPREIAGKPHHSLRSLGGVVFEFDADAVAARITAPPELLALNVIDFLARVTEDVEYPVGRSAFLNYGLTFRGGANHERLDVEGTAEAAVRRGNSLFLTDAIYRHTEREEGVVRLGTSVAWEDRAARQRLTLGDGAVAAGDLWASPPLGGIFFARLHRIDPYLVRHPTFGLAGQAPVPAEVRIYLDGVLVRTEKVAPGEFEIRNFDAYGGDRRVEVIVRDVFGRETRVERPFYFTDAVLRRGLHEFSYGAGWVRQDFGDASNRYGTAVASGFHRYGFSDALTLGLAGEAGDGVVSAGPTLSLVAGSHGTLSLALAAGRMDGRSGYAALLAHEYEARWFNTRLLYQHWSGGYRTLADESAADRAGSRLEAGFGLGTPGTGTIAFTGSARWLDAGADRTRLALDYRLGLFGKLSLFTSVARVEEDGDGRAELAAGVSYFPGRRRTVTAQYTRQGGAGAASLEFSQDRTEGAGLAWRGAALWREDETMLRPSLEYRGDRGILAGSAVLSSQGESQYRGAYELSAAGALLAAAGKLALARPVTDSFAIVKVGETAGLSGVRIFQGGSERGATGDDGTLVLPEVGAYVHNQISLEPGDVPLGYSIERIMRVIAPAERSGSLVLFPVARYQAVSGRLRVTVGGRLRPVEYVELTVRAGERSWSVPSGKGGEFFLENAGAGELTLSFRDQGVERTCALVVPESAEMMIDMGEVACEIAP